MYFWDQMNSTAMADEAALVQKCIEVHACLFRGSDVLACEYLHVAACKGHVTVCALAPLSPSVCLSLRLTVRLSILRALRGWALACHDRAGARPAGGLASWLAHWAHIVVISNAHL